MNILELLREIFGAKNNYHLALLIALDIVFFSLFGYVAWQSRDPAAWCVQNSGIPLDLYRNITNSSINWTLINLTQ